LVKSLNAQKVIAISILPRNNFDFSKLQWLNQSLSEALLNEENVTFLDVFDVFKKDNKLNPEYTTDGLHLSYWGYLLLTEHLSKLL
jgi:lysophospholipase L1-like esterase